MLTWLLQLQDQLIKLEKKRDKAGDDYNRVLEKYNAAQAQWVSDMVSGCNVMLFYFG